MALDIMRESGERWVEPELLRVQASIEASLRPNSDAAETLLRVALENARTAEALSFELRIACDLCELLAGSAAQQEALELVAAVLARFQEGFGSPDLVRAHALLGARSQCAGSTP
jgi:hypothetical protein